MERLDDYIEEHSSSEDNALREINHTTCLQVINSHMLSGRVQGRLLSLISHMIRPQRILELGTYTGYSALCLAEGLDPQGELITIEHNDELERRIRHNLSLSPYGVRVHPVIGDAKAVVVRAVGLIEDSVARRVKHASRGVFFIFEVPAEVEQVAPTEQSAHVLGVHLGCCQHGQAQEKR